MIDDDLVRRHRARALPPDRPVLRGAAQNPDVYFQARETGNPFYLSTPTIVQNTMDKFAAIVGRRYHLFDYVGAPDAERVIVLMGSQAEVAHEAVEALVDRGEKVGVIKVHLYRPFSIEHFTQALPPTVNAIAVLDRTKKPGAVGEPLYCDVVTALAEFRGAGLSLRGASAPPDCKVIGGRYGPFLKGIHPGHGQGRFRRTSKAPPQEPLHHGHQR